MISQLLCCPPFRPPFRPPRVTESLMLESGLPVLNLNVLWLLTISTPAVALPWDPLETGHARVI